MSGESDGARARPLVDARLLTQAGVLARLRGAHIDEHLTPLARVAGQAVAHKAADLVATQAAIGARLVHDHALVDVELARGARPARPARAIVLVGARLRAQAVVLARLRGAHVHDELARVARVAVETRARVVGTRRLLAAQATVLARCRRARAHRQLALGARVAGQAATHVRGATRQAQTVVLAGRAQAVVDGRLAVAARVADHAQADGAGDVRLAGGAVGTRRVLAVVDRNVALGARPARKTRTAVCVFGKNKSNTVKSNIFIFFFTFSDQKTAINKLFICFFSVFYPKKDSFSSKF